MNLVPAPAAVQSWPLMQACASAAAPRQDTTSPMQPGVVITVAGRHSCQLCSCKQAPAGNTCPAATWQQGRCMPLCQRSNGQACTCRAAGGCCDAGAQHQRSAMASRCQRCCPLRQLQRSATPTWLTSCSHSAKTDHTCHVMFHGPAAMVETQLSKP